MKTVAVSRSSELELFLKSQSAEGRVDSAGHFTLAREEALRKLATFQLPFEGAWAVKLIQAIVAGESTHPIRVDLLATEIRFFFLEPAFTLDQLEEAFFSPEPPADRSLRHLLSGLWPVALTLRWGFQVAFPGQSSTLIWDGQALHRVDSTLKRDCVAISLAPLQNRSSLSWVAGLATSGSRNADVLMTLATHCYTCPLPLTVDGRRIESLQRARRHGWSSTTFPISMGFTEAPLPALKIPPGTFEGTPSSLSPGSFLNASRDGGGWKAVGEKLLDGVMEVDQASLAFLVCVNLELVSRGKSSSWEPRLGPSLFYWVLDGAVVGEQEMWLADTHCSLACFVSAEGLGTDLTTLRLTESAQRDERVRQARTALHRALQSVEHGDFEHMVRSGTFKQRLLGGCIMAVGIGFMFVSPLHGLGATAAGAFTYGTAGSTEKSRVELARGGLRDLVSRLGNFYTR